MSTAIAVAYKKSFEELVSSLTDDCITYSLLPTHVLSGFQVKGEEDFGYPELPEAGSYALWSIQHGIFLHEDQFCSEPIIRLNVIKASPFGWVYDTQFELDRFDVYNCPIDFLIHAKKTFDLEWRDRVVQKQAMALQSVQKVHDEIVEQLMEKETIN